MGRVSNLRVVESLGSIVRLGWTGVAGATQYRIIILNTEGFTVRPNLIQRPRLNESVLVKGMCFMVYQ